jgi:hypothetical protein
MNKHLYFLMVLMAFSGLAHAQQVDSIYFNLYTDSLKKGVYNYINIDGKLSNGQWRPLTAKEVSFSATAGKFDRNCLVIDTGFKGEKVTLKASLIQNPSIWKEITVYIKKKESIEKLKTVDEIMNTPTSNRRQKRRGS